VGLNLAPFDHYSGALYYTNLFCQGTQFSAHYKSGMGPVDIEWNFYSPHPEPLKQNEDLSYTAVNESQSLFSHLRSNWALKSGRYYLSFEGEADPQFSAGTYDGNHKSLLIDKNVTDLMVKFNSFKNFKNPILIHESDLGQSPHGFNQLSLAYSNPFSVIRMLNPARINNSKVKDSSDLQSPLATCQSGENGASIEHLIAFTERAQKDIWICIPHEANDEYVKTVANVLASKTTRIVYFEYSNETWNSMFTQSQYCLSQAPSDFSNPWQAARNFHVLRLKEISDIIKSKLGDRAKSVLAHQFVSPPNGEEMLKNAYSIGFKPDYYAIAPYFGNELGSPEMAETVQSQTIDSLMDQLQVMLGETIKTIETNQKMVSQFSETKLAAYEMGSHLVGFQGVENNDQVTSKFHAMNEHPRMKDMYRELIKSWRQITNDSVFCIYRDVQTPTKWGSFGMLRDHNQNPFTSPRVLGFLESLT